MKYQPTPRHQKQPYKPHILIILLSTLLIGLAFIALSTPQPIVAQRDNPEPPGNTVKLAFIHHSTGENWLADDNGGLGLALGENNYFVSDTNYGWGPDSIGDRTDILNWPEWFTGPNSTWYLDELYNLSDQNSWYTRPLADPGGENEIIMFKSCFPNSALEGSPNDPPNNDDYLSVGGAKRVYNDLLTYFATRQDKLFVVITAPPLQDPTYAANARAFNNWLMTDWLQDYPYPNVAVFDFYTVLTTNGGDPYVNDFEQDTGNHHRFHNGVIQHITDGDDDGNPNVSEYPSGEGDDHPSQAGNQKATGEFIPMLNIFYHRWKSGAPPPESSAPAPPSPAPTEAPAVEEPEAEEEEAAEEPHTIGASAMVDDFEGTYQPDQGWDVWSDDQTADMAVTLDNEVAHEGSTSLRMEFVGWADFGRSFYPLQDWSDGIGLSFWLRFDEAAESDQEVSVTLFSGDPQAATPFDAWFEIPPQSADPSGWTLVELPWDQFPRADWADQNGLSELDPAQMVGIGFSFVNPDDSESKTTVWIDDIRLLDRVAQPAPAEATPAEAEAPAAAATATEAPAPPPSPASPPEDEGEEEDETGGLCPISVSLALAGLVLARRSTTRQ